MQRSRRTVLMGAMLGLIMGGCLPPESSRDMGRSDTLRDRPESARPVYRQAAVDCSGPHRLQVLDLDMEPDPIRPGQSIDTWRITLQADQDGECDTTLTVRDQNEIAGRGQKQVIRPGRSVYTIAAVPDYRFQRQDACFQVQANVGGTFTAVDAARTFCVRSLAGNRWSLRDS